MISRKDFLTQVGKGAVALAILPACISALNACSKAPTNVDFTVDTSTGNLSSNGGYIVKDGVIVARTNTGTFIAVAAACTHEGTDVEYNAASNNFTCPNHGAQFNSTGSVTKGPASSSLKQYKTTLTGTSLRVFS